MAERGRPKGTSIYQETDSPIVSRIKVWLETGEVKTPGAGCTLYEKTKKTVMEDAQRQRIKRHFRHLKQLKAASEEEEADLTLQEEQSTPDSLMDYEFQVYLRRLGPLERAKAVIRRHRIIAAYRSSVSLFNAMTANDHLSDAEREVALNALRAPFDADILMHSADLIVLTDSWARRKGGH